MKKGRERRNNNTLMEMGGGVQRLLTSFKWFKLQFIQNLIFLKIVTITNQLFFNFTFTFIQFV